MFHDDNLIPFTWQEDFNITAEDLNDFFGGPAFLAWARLGNLHAWAHSTHMLTYCFHVYHEYLNNSYLLLSWWSNECSDCLRHNMLVQLHYLRLHEKFTCSQITPEIKISLNIVFWAYGNRQLWLVGRKWERRVTALILFVWLRVLECPPLDWLPSNRNNSFPSFVKWDSSHHCYIYIGHYHCDYS